VIGAGEAEGVWLADDDSAWMSQELEQNISPLLLPHLLLLPSVA